MPFNGTGTFSLTATSVAPAVSNTTIESSDFNTTMTDIVAGLNTALCRDGQSTPSANLPMATYRHTGVGNAAARTDYAAAGQVQDSSLVFDATETGTGDAYEIALSPAITAYAAGQRFGFIASEACTGASTLNVNSVGAVAIKKTDGTDTVTGDILANQVIEVVHNGTNFILMTALPGVTATAAEINILDGATLSTAELNILDGVTSSTAELNILDGVTATAAEINYLDKASALGTCEAGKVVTTTTPGNVITAATITTLTSTTANITTLSYNAANVTSTGITAGTRRVNYHTGTFSAAVAYPTESLIVSCVSFIDGTVRVSRTHDNSTMYTAVYLDGVSQETAQTGAGAKTTDIAVNKGDIIQIYGNCSSNGCTGDTISDLWVGVADNTFSCCGPWY